MMALNLNRNRANAEAVDLILGIRERKLVELAILALSN